MTNTPCEAVNGTFSVIELVSTGIATMERIHEKLWLINKELNGVEITAIENHGENNLVSALNYEADVLKSIESKVNAIIDTLGIRAN